MTIGILILAIAFLSLKQDEERKAPALVLSGLAMAHYILFNNIGESLYFEIAIITDIVIIECLFMLPKSRLTKQLLTVIIGFIIINVSSWVAWEYYLNYEQIYHYGAIILYLLIVSFLMEGYQDGNYRINWKDSLLRMFNNKSRSKNCEV